MATLNEISTSLKNLAQLNVQRGATRAVKTGKLRDSINVKYRKIGVAKDLAPLMERVFAINPSIIPDDVFNKYSDAVMMMGERAAVLNLNEYSEIKEKI